MVARRRLVVVEVDTTVGSPYFLSCFDVPSGKRLWKLPRRGNQLAISPDGRSVVSADMGTFRVIETSPETGAAVEHTQQCRYASPNDRMPGVSITHPDSRRGNAIDCVEVKLSHPP